MESFIEVLNPLGAPRKQVSKLASRRHESLAGRRFGLLDNNKPKCRQVFAIDRRIAARVIAISNSCPNAR
jgi:hypothetical protein